MRPDRHGQCRSAGIYSDAQVKGWRAVVEAVHAKGRAVNLFSNYGMSGTGSRIPVPARRRFAGAHRRCRSRRTRTDGARKAEPRGRAQALRPARGYGVVESVPAGAITRGMRFRRRRDPRRQWLSDGTSSMSRAPNRRTEPLWRLDPKTRPASDGDRGRSYRRCGAQPIGLWRVPYASPDSGGWPIPCRSTATFETAQPFEPCLSHFSEPRFERRGRGRGQHQNVP